MIQILTCTDRKSTTSTFLQSGTSRAQGIFMEMFITAALVLSALMLAAEKHQTTAFAPV
jgi:aquaporin related protein